MEKHQYGFAVMNWRTGNDRRKSFWGTGETEEDCKKDARRQANAYAEELSEKAYQKAREQAIRKGEYLPSRECYKFGVTGCSLWK